LLQVVSTSFTPSWFIYLLQIHFPLKLLCFTLANWLIRHKCQGDPDPRSSGQSCRVIRSLIHCSDFADFLKVILFTPPLGITRSFQRARPLTILQFDELLINMLPMSTNLLGIVFAHIKTSEETLRYKVKDALLLARGNGASRCGWPTRGQRWLIGRRATRGGVLGKSVFGSIALVRPR
jgi:hypothetical protein